MPARNAVDAERESAGLFLPARWRAKRLCLGTSHFLFLSSGQPKSPGDTGLRLSRDRGVWLWGAHLGEAAFASAWAAGQAARLEQAIDEALIV
jgi:hypothetical protein